MPVGCKTGMRKGGIFDGAVSPFAAIAKWGRKKCNKIFYLLIKSNLGQRSDFVGKKVVQ